MKTNKNQSKENKKSARLKIQPCINKKKFEAFRSGFIFSPLFAQLKKLIKNNSTKLNLG
jgi:hypothetical protein